MKVYSVVWFRHSQTYFLYDKEGGRIRPEGDDIKYGFSFLNDYHTPHAAAWAQLLESLELDEGLEFLQQAEIITDAMKDAFHRVMGYWLDRGRTRSPVLPDLIEWSRRILGTPVGETEPNFIYTDSEANSAVQDVITRFVKLVKDREYPNYGHYWSNPQRVELLDYRLQGLKFDEIGEKMGRTRHAARSEYGRIRRGTNNVTIELEEFDLLRDALPLGPFQKKEENSGESDGASANI